MFKLNGIVMINLAFLGYKLIQSDLIISAKLLRVRIMSSECASILATCKNG